MMVIMMIIMMMLMMIMMLMIMIMIMISHLLGQGDEVLAHALVELLVLHAQYLHGRLAHLAHLGLGEHLGGGEGVQLDVQRFLHLQNSHIQQV